MKLIRFTKITFKLALKVVRNICIFVFTNLPKKYCNNSILLLRIDAIGDYILFRNFINILKISNEYQNFQITLVGNIAWKSLSEYLDEKYIHNYIWLDKRKYDSSFLYKLIFYRKITSQKYSLFLSPVYSREYRYGETIARLVKAEEKIGNVGNLSNITDQELIMSNNFYTRLIDANQSIKFEFYRNKEFFENLLQKSLEIEKPEIYLEKPPTFKKQLSSRYAVLFIGGGSEYRKWDIRNYVEIAHHLKSTYQIDIFLCGGNLDQESANLFSKLMEYPYMNLVNNTSLVDLLFIIKHCYLMISNESSGPHMAAALSIKNLFVISNGNDYLRFTPYPPEIFNNYYGIYHPKLKELTLNNKNNLTSKLNINEISFQTVKNTIDGVLYKDFY